MEKDSPPNSNIGQTQGGSAAIPQRRAYSQLQSLAGGGSLKAGLGHEQQEQHKYQPYINYQPIVPKPIHQPYVNYQPIAPEGISSSTSSSPQHVPPPSAMRPPQASPRQHTPHMMFTGHGSSNERARIPPLNKGIYSTPVQETLFAPLPQPHMGAQKNRQGPSHYSNYPTKQPLKSSSVSKAYSCDSSLSMQAPPPLPGSISPSEGVSDISRDIDSDIQHAATHMGKGEMVEEDVNVPYDPNLVCMKCSKRFRVGQIQEFRKHVSSAHN